MNSKLEIRRSTLVIRPLCLVSMKPVSDFFIPFPSGVSSNSDVFSFNEINPIHPLCELAAKDLQLHLLTQTEWNHNFGLETGKVGQVIGKMFGVLVVSNEYNQLGYLAAFSGKLAGQNHFSKFVPPVFDTLAEDAFVNDGMIELARINGEIKRLQEDLPSDHFEEIKFLKAERKDHSVLLQDRIFNNYIFFNTSGKQKSLKDIFQTAGFKNPPSGAGECAAPKLFQFAFLNKLKPIALAEFWWGLSPKSETWKHREFYPTCKEKCELILEFMLGQ